MTKPRLLLLSSLVVALTTTGYVYGVQRKPKPKPKVQAAKPKPLAKTKPPTTKPPLAPGVPAFVWFEAETPRATNFPPADKNPLGPFDDTQRDALSGGKWIGTNVDRSETLFLEYDVSVPENGRYAFFARKFWQHGPFRWRFDNGAWQTLGHASLLDETSLMQFVGANWVRVGEVELAKGAHTLRIELTENKGAAAFDAFVLTTTPFVPRGRLKPGERFGRAPEGWFAYEPDVEAYKESPIDLRHLNEKFAGENGFITTKGEGFIHRNTGQPVRFWAINTGHGVLDRDMQSLRHLARGWAKAGINLVRLHGAPWGQDFRKVDPKHVAQIQRFVEAMKGEGIYTCLSIYFPLWLQLKEGDGFPGYKGKHPFALLYYNEEFQKIYRGWWTTLLTAPNPHGKPLAQEPAVAMLEMVNEDSTMFWTFTPYENIPAEQMAILEAKFGAFLAKRHGSLGQAFAAWGGSGVRGDDQAAGRAGFMPLWEVANKKDRRAQDTAAFLTGLMRSFYTDTYGFLKKDLGYKGSVYASNWITADARVLGPLDKWANTAADFMDRHGYFGGRHEGERASYSVSKGDKYEDRSALLFSPEKAGGTPDFSLPLWDLRYNNLPSTITEVNWTPPNRFRADFPVVAAAYGTLQGTDGIFFFASDAPYLDPATAKFAIRTPVTFGQFPAAALIYRQGLVKPGPVVADVNLNLGALGALRGAPVSAPANLDELRKKDIPAGGTGRVDAVSSIDPLAFLVGKVGITFNEADAPSTITDVSKSIDRTRKVVRSATGELAWDYGKGTITLNSPTAQGATGFLRALGTLETADATIAGGNEYGSILLVPLDGKPLKESSRILLQVMSEETSYGFEAPGTGLREIKSIGAFPIVVRNLAGTVSLKRADAGALRVVPLDFNGYRTAPMGDAKAIALRPDTIYYLIEKS